MIRLGVNIDHIATVRQARRGHEPDPVAAAVLATLGGADGITIHLREDRRHIQDRDVYLLRDTVRTRLNLEMAASDEILAIALKVKPDEATLVPEKRQELTTEGGLDVISNVASVSPAIERLKAAGIHVSLFIDPDLAQVEAAHKLKADAIEFQTASYSEAKGEAAITRELQKLRHASQQAAAFGLHIHMGHGLNYWNVQPIVRIPGVEELNIGHSIVSRAVLVGLERAVREMKQVMQEHYPNPRKEADGNPMRRIDGCSLWIGTARDARDIKSVLDAEIEAIVDLAKLCEPVKPTRELVYLRFPLVDGADNAPWLLCAAVHAVEGLVRLGVPTLVACDGGMSRSLVIAAAALWLLTPEASPEEVLRRVAASGPADVQPALWEDVKRHVFTPAGA